MTGFAFPEVLVDICSLMKSGNTEAAENLFYTHLPLIQFEQQEGIGLAIRKAGLYHRGFIKSPTVRSPAGQLASTTHKELKSIIEKVGL